MSDSHVLWIKAKSHRYRLTRRRSLGKSSTVSRHGRFRGSISIAIAGCVTACVLAGCGESAHVKTTQRIASIINGGSAMGRYTALYGANDPTCHYSGVVHSTDVYQCSWKLQGSPAKGRWVLIGGAIESAGPGGTTGSAPRNAAAATGVMNAHLKRGDTIRFECFQRPTQYERIKGLGRVRVGVLGAYLCGEVNESGAAELSDGDPILLKVAWGRQGFITEELLESTGADAKLFLSDLEDQGGTSSASSNQPSASALEKLINGRTPPTREMTYSGSQELCGTVDGTATFYKGTQSDVYAPNASLCKTALSVIATFALGDGVSSGGKSTADTTFAVDGWTCDDGQMGSEACSHGKTQIFSETLATAATQIEDETFQSPSGNIRCSVSVGPGTKGDEFETAASCDTVDPPESAEVERSGTLSECGSSCQSDYEASKTTLAYGSRMTLGPFTCASATSGVTCTTSGGKGFSIAKAGIAAVGGATLPSQAPCGKVTLSDGDEVVLSPSKSSLSCATIQSVSRGFLQAQPGFAQASAGSLPTANLAHGWQCMYWDASSSGTKNGEITCSTKDEQLTFNDTISSSS